VNRSTLSRWRRCRGVIPVGGLPAIILARLHMRLVAAREAERSRFEARLDVKHGRLSEQTAGRMLADLVARSRLQAAGQGRVAAYLVAAYAVVG